MPNTPLQKGTPFKLGIESGVTYSGTLLEDFSTESIADESIIKGTDGETITVITSDPGKRYGFTALILTTGGTLVAPAKNSIITVNSIAMRTESATVNQVKGAIPAKLTWKGIKEDSMTYT